jgi:hypothetical protein
MEDSLAVKVTVGGKQARAGQELATGLNTVVVKLLGTVCGTFLVILFTNQSMAPVVVKGEETRPESLTAGRLIKIWHV